VTGAGQTPQDPAKLRMASIVFFGGSVMLLGGAVVVHAMDFGPLAVALLAAAGAFELALGFYFRNKAQALEDQRG
jgi:hypothetical protein